jgi:hypothetical protein
MQSGRSERQLRPASQLPHECRSAGPTMDATDTAAPETRYRGRSQALLYNNVRPHSSLGYLTPIWQTQPPVMQRARSLRCVGLRALACCATRSARSTCRKLGTPSQASRGPKKPGRSAGPERNSSRYTCKREAHAVLSFPQLQVMAHKPRHLSFKESKEKPGWPYATQKMGLCWFF